MTQGPTQWVEQVGGGGEPPEESEEVDVQAAVESAGDDDDDSGDLTRMLAGAKADADLTRVRKDELEEAVANWNAEHPDQHLAISGTKAELFEALYGATHSQ